MTTNNSSIPGCSEFRTLARLSRREVLRIGGLSGLGLGLSGLLESRVRAEASTNRTFGVAKQVIMLYLHGGHPQQETFDPKPTGPSAVRGEFGAIPTNVPGVQFSEMLPRLARRMNQLAVIRSMSHENANHVTASQPAQTGHKHPPNFPKTDVPPSDSDFPPIGAVLDWLRRSRQEHVAGSKAPNSNSNAKTLPPWVRVGPLMRRSNGTVLHGQLPGFLGRGFASFAVDQALLGEDVRIDAVQPSDDLTQLRLTGRESLLRQFDRHAQVLEASLAARNLDAFYHRAFDLLSGETTRRAFDLASESAATRERYGRTEFGQRCLLARRLAEAGVPMVNVSYCHTPRGSWDTHSRNFTSMNDSLGPTLDTAVSALIDDLKERGRLDDTLVVVNAEFGRTPKINKNAGRDHWPWVYSLALAGAGVHGGTVHGASDNSAAYPTSHPHGPEDFAATLYHLLGVPRETVIHDSLDRPHQLIVGKSIDSVLV
ncbi:MAG: DUF1501 domain-containing protein [Planctomycetota bacterium]|nr:DUF1501 domain-containing protein [Planctomycetota bacterium]